MWYRLFILFGLLGLGLTLLAHRNVRTYTVHAVLSGSMGRAAPVGSLIIAKRLDTLEYKVGDIVVEPLVSSPGQTVTHRVVRRTVSATGVIIETKGDANPNGDSWSLPAGMLIGKVVTIIPLVGYVSIFLQSPAGYVFFALFLLLVFVAPLCIEAYRSVRV